MPDLSSVDKLYPSRIEPRMADNDSDRKTAAQLWILPIVTGLIGALAGLASATVTRLNSNDLMAKEYVSMAVDILRLPAKSEANEANESKEMRKELRKWAVDVINSYAKVQMSPRLTEYLASADGKKLLLKVVDDSKTDTGILVCGLESANPATLAFAIYLSNAILASGDFGSSYISSWKDEGNLTSSSMKGSISIIKDKNHGEEKSIPPLKRIIESQMKRSGISLPVVIRDNPSPKRSEWFLSIVVCP